MAVYPQSIKFYANITAGWTEITSDVIDKVDGFWGIRSNREVDRVADIGYMYMTLDNSTGKYAPALGSALAGWGRGTQVKMTIQYNDIEYIRFFGTVDSLKITGGALGNRHVYATVKTWMDYASKYPLVTTGIQSNKRADQALTTIVNSMPIPPSVTSFETGAETFANVFDATTNTTTALVEFNKLAMSEMGYIYERMDRSFGNDLTFQARTTRKGTDTPTSYEVPDTDSGFLAMVDGTSRVLQTDNTSKIKLNPSKTVTVSVDNNMQDIEVIYGENVRNRMTVVAYPRTTDTSVKVLAALGYPQQIGSEETLEIRVPYYDPTGGAKVNAVDGSMIAPVASTDYLMNTAQDGSGTDITADLTVTAVYGSEGVTWTLTNNNTSLGYITTLQARGYGIYTYASTESVTEDSTSYNQYGYVTDTIHQHYQQNTSLGKVVSAQILEKEKQPRTILNKVFLNANKTDNLMWGFLVYDVGDLVAVTEDISGIDSQYYIHAVNFSIEPALNGGIIDYSWVLKENQSLSSGSASGNGLSLITIEMSYDSGTTTHNNYVKFGNISSLNNVDSKTVSFWAKVSTYGGNIFRGGINSASRYWGMNVSSTTINFYQYNGVYQVTALALGTTWHHIVATKTRQHSVSPTAPTIYLDNVSQTVSTSVAQSITDDETGYLFHIGHYNNSSFDGQIKDLRIYNSILSSSDVSGIYNAGAGGTGYTSGLIFQAPVIRTSDLTYFTNHTLLSTDRLLDNIYGYVGTPAWDSSWTAPITRVT